MFELVDEKSLLETIGENPGMISVVQFSTDWCANCEKVTPILEELEKENAHENIQFSVVDVDSEVELSEKYKVFSIPTTCFLVDTTIVARIVGAHEKEVYESALNKLLHNDMENCSGEEISTVDEETAEDL